MYRITIISILFLLTLIRCNFLDEEPLSTINSETFYKTESDAIAATNAVYEYLTVGTEGIFDRGFGGIFFNDYWVFKDILSDNCNETIYSQDYLSLSDFAFTSENERIELYWQDLYKTINAANVVIDKVPLIEMSDVKKNHLIAEVKFIRAMMYFEAVRFFGGVPLILTESKDLSQALIPRATVEEVYEVILNDLNWSQKNLSNTYRVGKGRATPLACEALMSKVYLEKKDYQLAVDHSLQVIESGQHPLFKDFADLFKLDKANSGEIIFAVNYSGTLSQGFKPNQYSVRLLPPNLHKNGEGPQNAFGWEVPSDDLYHSFENGDRRKEVTFITSFTYSDGQKTEFRPYISKFWDREKEPLGNTTDMDVIYLRTADIMLVCAEALNELHSGPNEMAYHLINSVRARARFNGSVNLEILEDLEGLTYEAFRDAILRERRHELVMEGSRYHDLVRMDKLVEKVSQAKPQATPKDYHTLLPVPQRELNLNPNLTQNSPY